LTPAVIPPAAFRKALLRWYDASRRDLPWRASNDFYRVWISEIMLQQTRVEAVVPFYLRFLERFPSIGHLAEASQNDVLTMWSGLGYYSRARNLHLAAKRVASQGLPENFDQVLALPGVGSYTAAAVASIALGLPHAAVDGNVVRVISRLTNDAAESTSPPARRRFADKAKELLDMRRPGDFNQAMMELGATICVPRSPQCTACPVQKFCAAQGAGTQCELPVRLKNQTVRELTLHLVILERDGRIFLVRRPASERRLAGFWELPEKRLFRNLHAAKKGEFGHRIVNDRFRVTVWNADPPAELPPGKWYKVANPGKIPLTTTTKKALASNSEYKK
jgi:A/G-specific adenine glycosylase